MYSLGLIENFENWVEYREKRNITSHEYNLKLTYTILDCVQNFINDVEFLVDNLEKVLTDD